MSKVQFIILGIALLILNAVCQSYDITYESELFWYIIAPLGVAGGFLVAHIKS